MAVNDILKRRAERENMAVMKKMAESKPSFSLKAEWPENAEIKVKNLGDVLKSLALLGKGIAQLNESVGSIQTPDIQLPDFSGLSKAIASLSSELKKSPKNTKIDLPPIEIPKSFRVENLDELKRGFVSINDNLVKLADVIRDSQPEIAEQDDSLVISAVERVENAVKGIVFPIPTPTTPSFKNTSGEGASAVLTTGGAVPVSEKPSDTDITTHTNYARKYYTNSGAVTDGIVWSPAAGKRWHVTSLYVQVSADCTVTFEDDLAAGDSAVLKGEFKAGSGLAMAFDKNYPLASGEDAADLLVTTSAGNVYVTAVGYEV